MVKVRYFDYEDASLVLKEKGLLLEIEEILHSITSIDHNKIQRAFLNKGWETEKQILPLSRGVD